MSKFRRELQSEYSLTILTLIAFTLVMFAFGSVVELLIRHRWTWFEVVLFSAFTVPVMTLLGILGLFCHILWDWAKVTWMSKKED